VSVPRVDFRFPLGEARVEVWDAGGLCFGGKGRGNWRLLERWVWSRSFFQTWKVLFGVVGDAARVIFLLFITIIINNCHLH
jgi:hypothetical protein